METNNDAFYYIINLEFWSKTVVEDIAMIVVTEPNLHIPLLRVNEGMLHFGSVTTKYPMCDNDWLTVVLIL